MTQNAARNYVLFPISLIEQTIEILKENGAVFALPRDCGALGAAARGRVGYLREYATWAGAPSTGAGFAVWSARRLLGRRVRRAFPWLGAPSPRPGQPSVFLQHDADRNPANTLAVMEAERACGAVSAAYFFRRRAARWPGDEEPYELDLVRMKEFERNGFEIGYHLNGPELADYDVAGGTAIIDEDVRFFREHFDLRSFVPHGGRSGPGGVNNHHIRHEGSLADLIWVYNGRGLETDVSWSDGHVESPGSAGLEDPRDVARRVRGRMRAHFLFHPQYYGSEVRADVSRIGVARTAWWRSLWTAGA